MPRRLHRRRGIARSIRGIARYELSAALVAARAAPTGEAVHEVRQRLKRLRALLRLAQRHFRRYRRENRALRDLGRRLAGFRDAAVLARSFDALVARSGAAAPEGLRESLLARYPPPSPDALAALFAGDLAEALEAARRRAGHWRFRRRGPALVGAGFERTWRQMRAAGVEAARARDAASLHDWRKLVKYHAAQLDLLAPLAPARLAARQHIADALGDVLGEHHDLDVLRAALRELGERPGVAPMLSAIAVRCAELEATAFGLGKRLAAESLAFRRHRVVLRRGSRRLSKA